MALTAAHIKIVGAYIGTAWSLPASARDDINTCFIAAGLAPVYTDTRLRRALYNRKYLRRLAWQAETMPPPVNDDDIDAMMMWMEEEPDGDMKGEGEGEGGPVDEWPDIDDDESAWEASMRSLVPFLWRDFENDFY